MLVCSVSQRPRRSGIAADVAESAAAVDALGLTGHVVFATLVDDPASVRDFIDAYSGEIMKEAASAAATVNAQLAALIAADVAEAKTAASTQDATVVSSITTAWDPATIASVTLSGGNLVTTNTATTSTNQGAHVISTSGKTAGKYYFEITWTTVLTGNNNGVGVGTTASTYTGIGNNATTGAITFRGQNIYSNGSQVQGVQSNWANGQVCGIAVDLDNRRIWFRNAPSGNWNYVGATANPATNVGGFVIPAGTMVPFITFGGTNGVINNVMTANFGASAFTGAVPAGFTSGWV